VLQGKQLSTVPAPSEKAVVITGYVEKFAAIAGRQMTPQLYSIYIEALDDLELPRIRQGLDEYLRKGKGWPWPGELREWIEEAWCSE
jgi:hypothetical protein